MQVSGDRLAQSLEGELGADAVTHELSSLAAYNVDGREPALLCFPATLSRSQPHYASVLKQTRPLLPGAVGQRWQSAIRLRQVDIVIGLERLNRLVEHDQANLTATVQSGHRLAALQEVLAQHNQFLPLDPPAPSGQPLAGSWQQT